MKKLILPLLFITIVSCDEDLAVTPDGSDVQVAEVITEGESEIDEVFHVVEDMPSFPGGMEAYNDFIQNNLSYPEKAKEMGIEGRVFLTFVVKKDGSISDLQVIRGIGAGCDEAALDLFINSPHWEPGKQRGKEVNTKMQVVVNFKLDDAKTAKPVIEEIEIPVKSNESN